MPLGSNLATPRGSIVSIDLQLEKLKKIFFSETTRSTALIFGMKQWLMVLYINCAIHAPGVKFGHAPGVDSLHRLTMGKKIFFSETTGPTALIFCTWQWLIVLYIIVPIMPLGSNLATPRGSIVSIDLQ